jgi:hypothetical protein
MKSNELTTRLVGKTDLSPGYYCDGGGLYLQVSKKYGTRSWVYRYSIGRKANGRQNVREMGLGGAGKSGITLEQARKLARECREHLQRGDDPLELRRAKRAAARAEAAKRITFKQAAEAYLTAHASKWSNEKHRAQWRTTLETYAYPVMGNLDVSTIDLPHVLKVLEPIWHTTTETASRLRGRIERILAWAAVKKFREGDNPAR